MKAYKGVNTTIIKDRALFEIIKIIDTYLRDLSPGVKSLTTLVGSGGGAGGGASSSASYVTIANEASLSAERKLAVNAPVTLGDSGPNTTVTLGVSLAIPNLTLGTTNAAGVAGSLIRSDATIAAFDGTIPSDLAVAAATGSIAFAARRDHVHRFPTSLQSVANLSTLTLTDNAVDQTLTGSLGQLTIKPTTQVFISPTTPSAIGAGLVEINADAGARIGLSIQMNTITTALTSQTIKCWEAKFVSSVGSITSTIFTGFAGSTVGLAPGAGAGAGNKAYQMHLPNLSVLNANGSWDEVFGAFIGGPKRLISNPTVTAAAGIKTEAATISATDQYGIWIAQQTAQQTATNRYGLKIDAQNSGTNRWGAYLEDRSYIESPAARAITVLSLAQLATGAVAGAHINLNDKTGDLPSPIAGDLWRNGAALNYRKDGATTVDLAGAAGGGITSTELFLDFGTRAMDVF